MFKKLMYATLATFTAFCGGVPGFGGSGKYPKSHDRLEQDQTDKRRIRNLPKRNKNLIGM